jgi:hypothetical protein
MRTMCDGSRWVFAAGLATAMLVAPAMSIAGKPSDVRAQRARAADSLRRIASERLMLGTLDARLQAMTDLEQASLLAPDNHVVCRHWR